MVLTLGSARQLRSQLRHSVLPDVWPPVLVSEFSAHVWTTKECSFPSYLQQEGFD